MSTLSPLLANRMLAAFVAALPGGSVLELLRADGLVVALGTLPPDPWALPLAGELSIAGEWTYTGTPAAGEGEEVASYRLRNLSSELYEVGSVTLEDGDGDMTLDDLTIAAGQSGRVLTLLRGLPTHG